MNDSARLERQNDKIKYLQKVTRLSKPHNMKAMRIKAGFSLREVEEDTGLSRGIISKIENGKVKNPSWSTLFNLILFYESEEQYRLTEICERLRLQHSAENANYRGLPPKTIKYIKSLKKAEKMNKAIDNNI
jgi:transcriptional regulator with XRE-family HTH domain